MFPAPRAALKSAMICCDESCKAVRGEMEWLGSMGCRGNEAVRTSEGCRLVLKLVLEVASGP